MFAHQRLPAPSVNPTRVDDQPVLRRRPNDTGPRVAPPIVHEVLRSPGRPLDATTRATMNSRFGHDFSRVRVHTGGHAADSAAAVAAHAYTVGSHIVFGAPGYQPHTPAGQQMLAHELTHVVQQRGITRIPDAGLPIGDAHSPTEAEAARAAAGHAVHPGGVGDGPMLCRQPVGPSAGPTTLQGQEITSGTLDEVVKTKGWGEVFTWLNGQSMEKMLGWLLSLSAEQFGLLVANTSEITGNRPRTAIAVDASAEVRQGPPAPSALDYFESRMKILPEATLPADQRDWIRGAFGVGPHAGQVMPAGTARAAAPSAPTAPPAPRQKGSGDASAITEEMIKPQWTETKKQKWRTFRDTRDAAAREYGAVDYADYVENILVQGGSVVGLKARARNPLHPLFLDRLEEGSREAQKRMGDTDFGIRSISGQENRPGNHAWGIASDFDADANPYVINEAGEKDYDAELEKVYQRIAKNLLNRDSVLTRPVPRNPKVKGDKGSPSKLAGASYDQIAEEADAMAAYFLVLDDPESDAYKKRAKLKERRRLSSATFPQEKLDALDKEQAQKDYDLLFSKKGAEKTSGDAVFTGGAPGAFRDPRRGFMSIRKEIAEAMRSVGLRWGAVDFPGECGDIMHFDDDAVGKAAKHHENYVDYGRKNPTEKRKAENAAPGSGQPPAQ